MNIIVNGENQELPANSSAQWLVKSMGMENDKIAMEVNREIVPRSQYASYIFSENDQIEIVRAIGGGQTTPNNPSNIFTNPTASTRDKA